MQFSEVRQKYPQYDDLPDEQLAGALHKKYYSDIPYEEFSSKVGLTTTPEEPGLLDTIGDKGAEILGSLGTIVNPAEAASVENPDTLMSAMGKHVQNLPAVGQMTAGGLMQTQAEPFPVAKGAMAEAAKGEMGWLDKISMAVKMLASGEASKLMMEPFIGKDLTPAREAIAEKGAEISKAGSESFEANQPQGLTGATKVGSDVARAVVEMAPAYSLAFLTKNPAMVPAVMGTQVKGRSMTESLDEGLEPYKASARSTFNVFAEGLPEYIPALAILKKGGAVSKMGWGALGEGAQEMVTDVLQQTYDKKELEGMPLKDAMAGIDWGQAIYSGGVGIGAGTSLGGVATGVDAVGAKIEERQQEKAHEKKIDQALVNIADAQVKEAMQPDKTLVDPATTVQKPKEVGPAASGATAQQEELKQARQAFDKAEAGESAQNLGGVASGAQQLTEQQARDEEARILGDRQELVRLKGAREEADRAFIEYEDKLYERRKAEETEAELQKAQQDTRKQNQEAEAARVVEKANAKVDAQPTAIQQEFDRALDEALVSELKAAAPEKQPTLHLPEEKDLVPVTQERRKTEERRTVLRKKDRKAERRGVEGEKRREQWAYRKEVDAMSDVEKDKVIGQLRQDATVNSLTGLGSRRAWESAEKKKAIGSIDADSLKFVNDKLGNKAGDELLAAIGTELKTEFGDDAFHVSGDEYWVQADTPEELATRLDVVQAKLGEQTATGPGGKVTGLGFSYGIAESEEAADRAMKQNKSTRTEGGLRVERGEQPPGVELTAVEEAVASKETAPEIITPVEDVEQENPIDHGTLNANPLPKMLDVFTDMWKSGGQPEPQTSQNPGVFTVADETGMDTVRRVFQDKFRRLEKTQQAIKDHSGLLDIDVNVHAAEERFHGKVEKDLMDFERDHIEPLIAAMAEQKVVPAQLSDYLYARHAEERNELIASRRDDMPDGGSGWTTEYADKVRASLESDFPDIEMLAKRVWAMLDIRRELLRTSSLASDDLIDTWEEQYEHYVPLKGRAVDGDKHPKVGAGFSIKGKESRVAVGRRTEADNVVYQVVQDVTESVIRSRKNEVGIHMLALVRENPNPGFWTIHEHSVPAKQKGLVKGKVQNVPVLMAMDPDFFGVKEDGKQYFIKLKDHRLAIAMQNLGVEKQGVYIQTLSSITRYLSSINTSLDPEFVISNFSRDIQTAVLNAMAEQDLHDAKVDTDHLVRKMVKDVVKAMPSMYRALKDKPPRKDNAFDQYAHDFMADGAKTGFFNTRDIEGQKRYVESLLKMAQGGLLGKGMKMGKVVADAVTNINGTIENGVRLSAYINSRETMERKGIPTGKARKRAAHLAKNLTVNFNRRGELSTALNAHFMFFNASVQGTAQFARTMLTLKKDTKTGKRHLNYAQKAAFALVTTSYVMALINRAASDDDDDGRTYYDKIPASVKERNMIFMDLVGENAGKNYTKIPLPYGYNIFWNLGQNTSDVAHGDLEVLDASLNLTNAVLGSFNPMGISADENPGIALTKTVTPTLLTPGLEVAINSNFWGGKIWKEDKFNQRTPDSALSINSKEHFQVMAAWLNEATGGTRYEKGGIDVSPDSLEHIFEFATGGIGRFASRTTGLVEKVHVGDVIEANDIPFARKLRAEPARYMTSANYYEIQAQVLAKEDALKAMRGPERTEFRKANSVYAPIIRAVKRTDKRLAALRKRRDRRLSKVESMKEINAIKREYSEKMDVEYNKVNGLWYDTLKENR